MAPKSYSCYNPLLDLHHDSFHGGSKLKPRSRRALVLAMAVATALVMIITVTCSGYNTGLSEYATRLAAGINVVRPKTNGTPQPTGSSLPSSDHAILAPEKRPEYPKGAAVIIETRMTPMLIPIMLHFSSVLGPDWPVVLFTLESQWEEPSSAAFRRAVAEDRIRIRHLPANTTFASHHSVSLFLTSPWLWEQVEEAPRVLLFQTDSVICGAANVTIDDFAEYDLIGAPILLRHGKGFNGGLSLRNPRLMLDIARSEGADFARDSHDGAWWVPNQRKFEDQWFYARALERGDSVYLPPYEVAMTFAVETIPYDRPLGYHQPERWQADRMDEILEYCPEVGMLQDSGRFVYQPPEADDAQSGASAQSGAKAQSAVKVAAKASSSFTTTVAATIEV